MAGFIEAAAADQDVELVPLVHFDLNPMGTITAEAFETLVGRMLEALAEQRPVGCRVPRAARRRGVRDTIATPTARSSSASARSSAPTS